MQSVQSKRKKFLIFGLCMVFVLALLSHWNPARIILNPVGELYYSSPDFVSTNEVATIKQLQISQPDPDYIPSIAATPDPNEEYKNVSPVWTYRCDVERGCTR